MGEVYKARDTRLDRLVALKVCKEEFTDRFEREARTIAQLNHPHICHLHDVGPNYLVMELVEGIPLKGPLPLDKAADYANQILDALDAAHHKGITHRDLKPANILVTRQGIKLLDFGLAKAGSAPLQNDGETLTQALTQAGQIVGTLQYMSPEQLQCKDVDGRSDLFAFGCVLYEMLSGRRAFEADSPASLIASVLEREPAPLNLAPPLDRLIRKCLAKDPEERFQTARDLKYNLALAMEQRPGAARPRRPWWLGALAGLAAGAAATLLLIQPREVDTLAGLRFTPLAVEAHSQTFPAFSPDGKSIAYEKPGPPARIMLRQLDREAAVELVEGATPFWSSDSRFVYFSRNAAAHSGWEIWRVSVTGGVPELILRRAPIGTRVFTPGGSALLLMRSGKVQISSPPGAEPADPPRTVRFPAGIAPSAFSPDGSKWLGYGKGKYWIVSYPQGNARELPDGVLPQAWFPDNRHMLLLLRNAAGHQDGVAVFDSETLRTRTIFRSPATTFGAALSPDGTRIVLQLGSVNWNVQEFSLEGKWMRDLVATSLLAGLPDWSPRGDKLAYVSDSSGTQDVWIRDDDGRSSLRLLKNYAAARLRFSPDGRRVAAVNTAFAGIGVVSASGGDLVTVARVPEYGFLLNPCWSPDGRTLAFSGASAGLSGSAVGAVGSNGGGQPAIIARSNQGKYVGPCGWASDGQSIYLAGSQLLRISMVDKSETVIPTQPLGTAAAKAFSADATRLYVAEPGEDNQWRLIQIETATGKTMATAVLDIKPPSRAFSLSPHPGGKRVALQTGGPKYDLWMLEGFPPAASPGAAWSRGVRAPAYLRY